MSRISTIISLARVSLSDKDKDRWSDDDLLKILNEGHKDVCKHSRILNATKQVNLEIGQAEFDLPDDCWLLTRATYDGKKIDLISHTKLDNANWLARDWEEDEGTPEAVIYDRRNLSYARVYPIPDDTIYDDTYTFASGDISGYDVSSNYGVIANSEGDILTSEFGVVVDISDFTVSSVYGVVGLIAEPTTDLAGESVYGVVTDVTDYTMEDIYGTVATFQDPGIAFENENGIYGVTTEIGEVTKGLEIQYIKYPEDITSLTGELKTPSVFDTALKFYVVGHAYLNDVDTNNQQKGAQQLAFYDRELNIAKETQASDGTRAGQFRTPYRSGFE